MEKKLKNLKTRFTYSAFIFSALILIITFGMGSCNNEKTEDTKEVAEESNDAKFENKKENDADFMVAAAGINLEEIQLG